MAEPVLKGGCSSGYLLIEGNVLIDYFSYLLGSPLRSLFADLSYDEEYCLSQESTVRWPPMHWKSSRRRQWSPITYFLIHFPRLLLLFLELLSKPRGVHILDLFSQSNFFFYSSRGDGGLTHQLGRLGICVWWYPSPRWIILHHHQSVFSWSFHS